MGATLMTFFILWIILNQLLKSDEIEHCQMGMSADKMVAATFKFVDPVVQQVIHRLVFQISAQKAAQKR